MAKKKTRTSKQPRAARKKLSFALSKQQKILLGSFLFFLGVALLFSFVSYFFTWQADQTAIGELAEREVETKNWLKKFGTNVGHFFIYRGFGIAAFNIAFLITLSGVYYFFNFTKKQLRRFWIWGILVMIWVSVVLGFFSEESSIISGVIGYEINDVLQDYLGFIGTTLILAFLLIVYLVMRLKLTPEMVAAAFKRTKKEIAEDFSKGTNSVTSEEIKVKTTERVSDEIKIVTETIDLPVAPSETKSGKIDIPPLERITLKTEKTDDVEMKIEKTVEEAPVKENLSDKIVKDFGEFDPTLELSNYKFPTIELLKDHTSGVGITINQAELEENKNKIVETLSNYKIGIASIKATVGPTVTLYDQKLVFGFQRLKTWKTI